jgi:hypothetical protein
MKYTLLIISILLLGNACLAQIQVSGRVSSESGDILPGTTVIEKGTTNGVTSNLDGEFSIKCITRKPTLVFDFVGMETQKISIKSDTTFNVFLIDSDKLSGVITISCFPSKVYKIGLNTGLNYNPLGIEIHNLISRLLPFNNHLSTNFKWRFITENKYLKFGVGQDRILRIGDKIPLGLKVNYEQISLESTNFSNRQFSISTTVGAKGWNTSVGYARREIKNHEDLTNSQNGITFGIEKWFFRRLNFKANTIYWSDDWQYSFHLDTRIPKTDINLGLDYEKVNSFEEIGISILYSFSYY